MKALQSPSWMTLVNIIFFDVFVFKDDQPEEMEHLNGTEVNVGAGKKLPKTKHVFV